MTAGGFGALYLAADTSGEVAILTVEAVTRGRGGFRVRRHYSGDIVGRAGWTGCGEVDALADALATVYGLAVPTAADRVTDRHALADYAEARGVYLYAAPDLVALVATETRRRGRAAHRDADRLQDAATAAALEVWGCRVQSDEAADKASRRYTAAAGHREHAARVRSLEAEVRARAVAALGDEGEADRLEAKADRLEAEADRLEREAADLEAEAISWAGNAAEATAQARRLADEAEALRERRGLGTVTE